MSGGDNAIDSVDGGQRLDIPWGTHPFDQPFKNPPEITVGLLNIQWVLPTENEGNVAERESA